MEMATVDFSVLFPDDRQCGTTVLRQAQLVMLRMFKIIDYICRKHKINYWMCSGTLLGAVRHKGFIPWDDDLDICMIREDYERFVSIAVEEFPADMVLQTRETDPNYHYLPLPCKVRDKKSFILSPGYEDANCEKGLFIDIFPMDRYHIQPVPFMIERCIKAYNMFICKSLDAIYFKNESLDKRVLAAFHPMFHTLVRQYLGFARRLIDHNRCLGTNCKLGHGFDTIWRRYLDYKDIFPVKELEFEGYKFFAPNNPDIYLRTLYGDNYMTPPPPGKRLLSQHAMQMKPILE